MQRVYEKMKIVKNKLFTISLFILIIFLLSSCGIINSRENNKKKIVTTQYPQYQFVKAIIGNDKRLRDYYEVSIIVPPGADSHTFDPRLTDLISIKNSDLFIYTSDIIETWIDGLEVSKYTNVLDLSSDERIELIEVAEHEHEDEHNHTHAHEADPHYWVYPIYASYMVDSIRNKMLEISPDMASECKAIINFNADNYIEKLKQIDNAIIDIVAHAKTKTLYFASPFSFYYWSYYYGLDYVLTYATCSTEVEPSVNTIIDVINDIKNNNVKVIYTKELLNDQVAKLIASQTGAEILLLHSCHSVSSIDFNNTSFLEIMYQNVINLAKGLGVEKEYIPKFEESEVKQDGIN